MKINIFKTYFEKKGCVTARKGATVSAVKSPDNPDSSK